ncbi:MAG: ATP-binding protein [Elusimicrobiota bacterium]|jgi:ATP-dependent DNA helicase RecG|nr:ATP-binding protein [Elusimicrobiota bacterium]
MNEKILKLISGGESGNIEFKECKDCISDSVYETVCSFLNTKGGDILLGVSDNKEILGVKQEKLETLKMDFINSVNNPNKISPPMSLSISDEYIDDKILLHIFVPESSAVHKCAGQIFIRNNSADFDITDNQHEMAALYLENLQYIRKIPSFLL